MSKPKIVSIFSGVGGIDFGFEKSGFQTIFATDIWDRACESLKVNLPDTEVIQDDIENIDFLKIKDNHIESSKCGLLHFKFIYSFLISIDRV